MTQPPDPTRRFSNRVENYLRYRPHYPPQIIDLLKDRCGLVPSSAIADVGSGTGMLAELFVKHGNQVFAVEPNAEMRKAAESLFEAKGRFVSVAGTAEATGLASGSVDFVTAGQAFHWFQRRPARIEFKRILRNEGRVVLVWNDRRTDSTPFLRAYEALLRRHATDYQQVDHKKMTIEVLSEFFGGNPASATFDNFQTFDLRSLEGRLLSSSYVPAAGQAGHEPMMIDLAGLFRTFEKDGRVIVEYDTRVFYGKLG